MVLMYVDDLPDDMRYDPEAERVVRDSGLRIECRHGTGCTRCVVEAARKIAAVPPGRVK